MADAPDGLDRTAVTLTIVFFIIGVSYLATLIYFCECKKRISARRSAGNGNTGQKKRAKTLKSKRGIAHKHLAQRVHIIFGTAKKMSADVRSVGLHGNGRNERQELRKQASAQFLAIALTLEEELVKILNEAGDAEVSPGQIGPLENHSIEAMELEESIESLLTQVYGQQKSTSTHDFDEFFAKAKALAKRLGPETEERITFPFDSKPLLDLEARIRRNIRFKDHYWHNKDRSVGESDEDDDDFVNRKSFIERWIPARYRMHPWFYGAYWGTYFAILISFFVSINAGFIHRKHFLSVPPQYSLKESQLQAVMVPILYGVMHTALYNLGMLPVGMMRGLLRDIAIAYPGIRKYVPIDDMVWFHKLTGTLCIGAIVVGSLIWLIAMAPSCIDGSATNNQVAQAAACDAFDPIIVDATTEINDELLFDSIRGAAYADPRDNVLFLRIMVWTVWPFGMPLINWVNVRPRPQWLPAFVKRNFFEIIWIIHFYGAIISLIAALYARFEVFYLMLISWGLWTLDKWRDMIFSTFNTEIIVQANAEVTSMCHRSDKDGKPTILDLRIKKPRGWNAVAGQILYVKVPLIDPIWHPFSLASCSADDEVHLHIGIIGDFKSRNKRGDWTQPRTEATWTYRLLQLFRKSIEITSKSGQPANIPLKLRGPFGSPFTKCFDPRYKGVVVIGAGTGLTSALSVLKEMVHRHLKGESDQYVWFVWSCRHVEDLKWAWRTLVQTLYEAYRAGAIDPSADEYWSPYVSTMIDWLSITIYVTRSDHEKLLDFLNIRRAGQLSLDMGTGEESSSTDEPHSRRRPPSPPTVSRAKKSRRYGADVPPPVRRSKKPRHLPPHRRALAAADAFDAPFQESNVDAEEYTRFGMPLPLNRTEDDFFVSAQGDDIYGTYGSLEDPDSEPVYQATSRTPDWLKSQMPRAEAEATLLKSATPAAGDFLVRLGSDGRRVLSVLLDVDRQKFEHHFLTQDPTSRHFTLGGEELFPPCETLEDAIKLLVEKGHPSLTAKLTVPTNDNSKFAKKFIPKQWSEIRRLAEDLGRRPNDEGLQKAMLKLLQENSDARSEHDLTSWLKQQILEARMDHEEAHIGALLGWVKEVLEDAFEIKEGEDLPVAVCFCGPSVLAQMINEAAYAIGGEMEYSAEHQ
jgi:hypothetical protein